MKDLLPIEIIEFDPVSQKIVKRKPPSDSLYGFSKFLDDGFLVFDNHVPSFIDISHVY